jgi:hypothetical protein
MELLAMSQFHCETELLKQALSSAAVQSEDYKYQSGLVILFLTITFCMMLIFIKVAPMFLPRLLYVRELQGCCISLAQPPPTDTVARCYCLRRRPRHFLKALALGMQ